MREHCFDEQEGEDSKIHLSSLSLALPTPLLLLTLLEAFPGGGRLLLLLLLLLAPPTLRMPPTLLLLFTMMLQFFSGESRHANEAPLFSPDIRVDQRIPPNGKRNNILYVIHLLFPVAPVAAVCAWLLLAAAAVAAAVATAGTGGRLIRLRISGRSFWRVACLRLRSSSSLRVQN